MPNLENFTSASEISQNPSENIEGEQILQSISPHLQREENQEIYNQEVQDVPSAPEKIQDELVESNISKMTNSFLVDIKNDEKGVFQNLEGVSSDITKALETGEINQEEAEKLQNDIVETISNQITENIVNGSFPLASNQMERLRNSNLLNPEREGQMQNHISEALISKISKSLRNSGSDFHLEASPLIQKLKEYNLLGENGETHIRKYTSQVITDKVDYLIGSDDTYFEALQLFKNATLSGFLLPDWESATQTRVAEFLTNKLTTDIVLKDNPYLEISERLQYAKAYGLLTPGQASKIEWEISLSIQDKIAYLIGNDDSFFDVSLLIKKTHGLGLLSANTRSAVQEQAGRVVTNRVRELVNERDYRKARRLALEANEFLFLDTQKTEQLLNTISHANTGQ